MQTINIRVLDDNPFYTSLYKYQLANELFQHFQEQALAMPIQTFTETQSFLSSFPTNQSVSFVDYHLETSFTGLDVLAQIKKHNHTAKVYIVTDESNAYILRLCLDAGADGIIFKNHELMDVSFGVIQQLIIEHNLNAL